MSPKKNITILILVIVLVAILFLLALPAYNNVALLKGEIKKHQEFLKEKEELTAKVNQLKQIYESRKDEINKVFYVLPPGSDIPNLIVQLEALTSENGLILERLNFIKQAKTAQSVETEDKSSLAGQAMEKSYKTLGISLSVSGSYQSFNSFLKALEFNARLMDIKSIDFSSAKTEEAQGSIFTFDISVEAYYQ